MKLEILMTEHLEAYYKERWLGRWLETEFESIRNGELGDLGLEKAENRSDSEYRTDYPFFKAIQDVVVRAEQEWANVRPEKHFNVVHDFDDDIWRDALNERDTFPETEESIEEMWTNVWAGVWADNMPSHVAS